MPTLTKSEARAILAAQAKILRAIDALEQKLQERNLAYAQAYYLGHTWSAWDGTSYGSAPIREAERTLNKET